MQEQNEQNEAKPVPRSHKKDFIWTGICAAIFLVLLGVGFYVHKDIPMTRRGESHTPYPWIGDAIAIKDVEARWVNTAESGSPYMQSHLGYAPKVTLHIAEGCGGSGSLAVRVTDSEDTQQANPVYLRYNKGKFATVTRRSADDLVEADGLDATLNLICGMGKHSKDAKDFMYHVTSRDRKLWKVHVYYKPDGEQEYTEFGSTTIPATGDEL